jgi:hypothetical protein
MTYAPAALRRIRHPRDVVIDAKTRSCRIHREPREGRYAHVTDFPAGTILRPAAIPAIVIDLAAIDSSR